MRQLGHRDRRLHRVDTRGQCTELAARLGPGHPVESAATVVAIGDDLTVGVGHGRRSTQPVLVEGRREAALLPVVTEHLARLARDPAELVVAEGLVTRCVCQRPHPASRVAGRRLAVVTAPPEGLIGSPIGVVDAHQVPEGIVVCRSRVAGNPLVGRLGRHLLAHRVVAEDGQAAVLRPGRGAAPEQIPGAAQLLTSGSVHGQQLACPVVGIGGPNRWFAHSDLIDTSHVVPQVREADGLPTEGVDDPLPQHGRPEIRNGVVVDRRGPVTGLGLHAHPVLQVPGASGRRRAGDGWGEGGAGGEGPEGELRLPGDPPEGVVVGGTAHREPVPNRLVEGGRDVDLLLLLGDPTEAVGEGHRLDEVAGMELVGVARCRAGVCRVAWVVVEEHPATVRESDLGGSGEGVVPVRRSLAVGVGATGHLTRAAVEGREALQAGAAGHRQWRVELVRRHRVVDGEEAVDI